MAVTRDDAGSRIAAVLDGLALQNASGAVKIDGNPGGTIYLDQGQPVYACASSCPDLLTRLRRQLPAVPGLDDLVWQGDRPDHDLGADLVAADYLTRPELAAIVGSVTVDALIALTESGRAEASVVSIRFEPGSSHWAGSLRRPRADAVRAEVLWRAERMARCPVAPATRLELCDLPGGRAVLTREQWELAMRIDGGPSAGDLSRACGLALYDTVELASALVKAGLCATIAEPRRLADSPAALLPADGPVLPRRTGAMQTVGDLNQMARPSMEMLRRVAEGLRQLS